MTETTTHAGEPTLISAVILSYNSAAYIKDCLEKLQLAYDSFTEPCDIWVVENGSKDNSLEILRELERKYSNLNVIAETENTGTTVSRNKAIAQSSGQFVLVLDSDAFVDSDCLSGLLSTLEAHPECGIAVPSLFYPDGRFQLSYDTFPTLPRKLSRLFFLKSIETTENKIEVASDVDYAISALWLVRRAVFETVGLLDENIFYSPEDVDFCLRTWLGGYSIMYQPQANAIHDAQELSRGAKISKFALFHAQGLFYYFRKHGYIFSLRSIRKKISLATSS